MKNVACVIVTYNPDENVIETLKKLISENVFIVLIDNGSENSKEFINLKSFIKKNDIVFHFFKKNKGLATAQNFGINIAKEKKCEYITFFDQDTVFPENFCSQMLFYYNEFQMNHNLKLGILAPDFLDKNTKEYSRFAVFTEEGFYHKKLNGSEFEEVSLVISSGSFMKIATIEKVGLFLDDYFIDQIDVEYSLRLLSHGYNIVVTSKVIISHTLGDRQIRKLFFLTFKPNNHNAVRKYYIFRNGMNIIYLYSHKFKGIKQLILMRLLHDFLGVIFFETSKKEKVKAIIRGVKDSRNLKLVE